jgi:hypothetical protein
MQSTGYYQTNQPPAQQQYMVQQQQQQQQQQSPLPTRQMPRQLNQVILDNGQDPLEEDDLEEDDEKKPARRSGRRKIKIEYIEDKTRRHITFSKRKAGIMKKVCSLSNKDGYYTYYYLGLRVEYFNRHSGAIVGGIRNWFSVYFHNAQVTTTSYKARRQESDSILLECS